MGGNARTAKFILSKARSRRLSALECVRSAATYLMSHDV